MAAQNDEIRELFINGVNEVFTTLFNDGVTEGVYYYPQIDVSTNVYGEKKDKVFGNPVLLPARVQFNVGQDVLLGQQNGELKMLKNTATITIPLKAFLDNNIDVSESNYFSLRQGLLRYKETFFEVQNINPSAFVEQVFLLYNFTGKEITDMGSYIIPEVGE